MATKNYLHRSPNSYKLGIIGVGMVGGATQRYFENNKGLQPFLYDKYRKLGSPAAVAQADIIFLCVPTPHDTKKGHDLSMIKSSIRLLKKPKVLVIKSTVLPGTTEGLQEKYPRHTFLFNPEFLTESTADQDMSYPDRQIIGYTKKRDSYAMAGILMQLLPLAPFQRVVSTTEAETVKYFNNTWFATKVSFANQMYEICETLGLDYDNVKECAAADKRIGPSHLDVFHKGYRGYGGKCLPKDVRSFLKFAANLKVNLSVLAEAEKYNTQLTKGNKNK